jgi:hypothetical protein
MSKTTSKTVKTTTNKKATKTSRKAPAVKSTKKAVEAVEVKEKGEKTPKHSGVKNMGQTICSEQVGIHWTIAIGEELPIEGGLAMVTTPKGAMVPLMIRVVKPKVNGETFCQGFLVEKGSQHHELLAVCKGELVTVQWL